MKTALFRHTRQILRAMRAGAIGAGLVASAACLAPSALAAGSAPPRILKFSGVPVSQAGALRKKFPFVFEREVKLSEVDEIVRWLMATGAFSNIEVVERHSGEDRELILVASVLRKIQDVKVSGNSTIPTEEIIEILGIGKGKPFERKNLLESAKDLQAAYADKGYYNSRVEIDFDLPNDNEVRINIRVIEGPPTKVSDVLIDTPNPDLSSRMRRFAKKLIDRKLTGTELIDFQKNVGEYLQSNRYITARLSDPSTTFNADRTQVKLGYTIENPWKFEFIFDGNSYFTDGAIIRQLELDKLSGAVSSPAPDLADKIRRFYQTAGYANVEVTFEDKLVESAFRQELRFKIKEGPRVRIKKVEVSGNVSRPSEYYAQFIKSSSSDLIGQGFYNRRDIEDGTRKLVTELQNQGYMRARVQSSRIEYSDDKSSVTVYLNLDEGPLTQIRQIRFQGAKAFPTTKLLSLLSIKSGAGLSLRDLEDSLQKLKDFYRAEGYLEMRILNENEKDRIVSYNDTNTQAVVDFQLYEGPKISVGSISLQGNSFTKDQVILRELEFKKGDVLTPSKLDDTIYRLQNLRLFSRVNIRTLEEGTAVADRTIVVEVTERNPGQFTLGIGAATEQNGFIRLRGYTGIAYSNLFGTGRAVSLRVDPSYSTDPKISYVENRITLSYLEPYIFNDPTRGRVNLIREQSYFGVDQRGTLIQESNTINLLAERDLSRHVKLTHTAYSFSNQLQFYRANFEIRETQNIAKMGPLLEIDYRDDLWRPSKGSYSFIGAEYSDPLFGSSDDRTQSIKFLKTYASVTHYQRIRNRRDLVWANSLRGGYLVNLSPKSTGGVPYSESFFLGGRTTIRGFDAGELERIPSIYELGVGSRTDFRMTGESYYYLLKTELRFPIWHSSNFDLGGAIFYDGGAVLLSQIDLPDPYRDSIGVGLRIPTPVGDLNLEVGWKLDRRLLRSSSNPKDELRESPAAFHFSIGTF